MKRAPIVLAGTAAGLIGVISYHTASAPSAQALSSASTAQTTTSAASTSTSSASATTTTTTTKTKAKAKATSAKKSSAATTRTVTGEDVDYQYGDIEVKVTKTGSRITNISVVKLDVTDPRSEQIDEVAVPELRSQAMSAQSAKIDGVSGASYTSSAYAQSLQSALDKLA